MTSKFNMTTATVTDLVNTLGVQRTVANAIDSAKPKSLHELLAVRGMSQEIIDELDSSVEIIYYEDSRNDSPLKPESNPALISQTHDHLPLAADSTERMLRHLLDRQEEASRQQEEWRRYVDQRQNETNQVLLEMLRKLTGSVAEPPADPPTVVNPVITEASDEEGKGTLCIAKNASEKVRLGGELRDYVPDDNLAQRHTGNVRDEINVDIAQTADTYPHSVMNSPSSSQQQEFTSMPKLQNVYDTCVVDGVYQPSMSQSKKIIQNGLDLSGIQHVDGKVIVDGVIRRPSIAPHQNPANRQSRQNPANMPTRQIPANMPIRQIPETMPIRKNVPRQADMYCEDDLANDHHEYPQPHVRPPMAQGPTTANMPPPHNTYVQGRPVDKHWEIGTHNELFGPSNAQVRPPRAPGPAQRDHIPWETAVNTSQQVAHFNPIVDRQCSPYPYNVSHSTRRPPLPPMVDNFDNSMSPLSDMERLEHDAVHWGKKLSHLPKFDGNNWQAFITVFERHVDRHNLPTLLRLDLLEMKLTGRAFQAYGSLAGSISTYEGLKEFLQGRFGCRITAQIRRSELFNIKQKSDESLVDYSSRVKFVAGEGYPDIPVQQRAELEVNAFLQGCYDKTLAERVMQNTYDDLESALNAMVRVVQNARIFKSHSADQAKAVRMMTPVNEIDQEEIQISRVENSYRLESNVEGLRRDVSYLVNNMFPRNNGRYNADFNTRPSPQFNRYGGGNRNTQSPVNTHPRFDPGNRDTQTRPNPPHRLDPGNRNFQAPPRQLNSFQSGCYDNNQSVTKTPMDSKLSYQPNNRSMNPDTRDKPPQQHTTTNPSQNTFNNNGPRPNSQRYTVKAVTDPTDPISPSREDEAVTSEFQEFEEYTCTPCDEEDNEYFTADVEEEGIEYPQGSLNY